MITFSALERITVCPASAMLPSVNESSDAAELGTSKHELLKLLPTGCVAAIIAAAPPELKAWAESLPDDIVGAGPWWQAEVAIAYNVHNDTARLLGYDIGRAYQLADGEIAGTLDLLRVDGDLVTVVDHKTGFMDVAPPARNHQLRACALVAARLHGATRAKVGIHYTARNYTEWANLDSFDLADIADGLRSVVAESAKQAGRKIPDVTVGAHCRYCPAIRACPAHAGILRTVLDRKEGLIDLGDAQAAYVKVKAAKAILAKVEQAVYAFAAQHPIDLGDGMVLGETESTRKELDVAKAIPALSELYGAEVAQAAVEASMTQTSLERALKAAAPPRGLAAMKREAMAAIEAAGGLTEKTTRSVREHRSRQ